MQLLAFIAISLMIMSNNAFAGSISKKNAKVKPAPTKHVLSKPVSTKTNFSERMKNKRKDCGCKKQTSTRVTRK